MNKTQQRAASLSPILFEVIRNRLVAITEEMRIALQSVSGSPTVTEASDFFTGLFLPNGSVVSMGFQVAYHAPVCSQFVRHISDVSKQTIHDQDMFIGNDPYIAALHQNDVQMVGPIFADGDIVMWAGVEAHETDVGGMDFASWSPRAREVFQEGMRIPCVKLVDRGELREDVLDMILAASRLPASAGARYPRVHGDADGGALTRERSCAALWCGCIEAGHRAHDRVLRDQDAGAARGVARRRVPWCRLPRARRPLERALQAALQGDEARRHADPRLLRLQQPSAGLHQLHALGSHRRGVRLDPADARLGHAVERGRSDTRRDRRARMASCVRRSIQLLSDRRPSRRSGLRRMPRCWRSTRC